MSGSPSNVWRKSCRTSAQGAFAGATEAKARTNERANGTRLPEIDALIADKLPQGWALDRLDRPRCPQG